MAGLGCSPLVRACFTIFVLCQIARVRANPNDEFTEFLAGQHWTVMFGHGFVSFLIAVAKWIKQDDREWRDSMRALNFVWKIISHFHVHHLNGSVVVNLVFQTGPFVWVNVDIIHFWLTS